MNIIFCPLQRAFKSSKVVCPSCHSDQCTKHGFYERNGFHVLDKIIKIPMRIQRFRCTNPQCKRRTFSVLPPMVLRYCRFLWPCLQRIWNAVSEKLTPYRIARLWNVDRAVIVRAAALQLTLHLWVKKLHQEITDGRKSRSLTLMVKVITFKIGLVNLMNRWYCHHFPKRFLLI